MFSNISANETRLLPVFVYGSEELKHQIAMKWSTGFVAYSQFSICVGGTGVFVDDNGTKYTVKNGDIMYFNASTPNSYFPTTDTWKVKYILAGGGALKRLMSYLGFLNSGVISTGDDYNEISKLFTQIIELNNSTKEENHAKCSKILYKLLWKMGKCIEFPSNKKVKLLKPCVDYIKSNYMKDISMSELAKSIGLTPTYFGITFKEVYKMNPQTFLRNTRIENAKKMLVQHKHLKLLEVSSASGFNSVSYFCNTFKKCTNMTPEEYRSFHTYD